MRCAHRFREDVRRYLRADLRPDGWAVGRALYENEALWAIGVFRFGQYLREEASPLVRKVLRAPYALVHRAMKLLVGIHLSPQTEIGPGLYIGHHGGIWISPLVRIGKGCNINHETTIGTFGDKGAPVLGDRVWVGPNATISGPVKIGDGAVIAANSLVATDLPQDSVAVGVPARVISRSGSGLLLRPRHYTDPAGEPRELVSP